MELSKNISLLEESGIRKIFEMANQAGPKAINLSIGQPHFPVSTELKNLAKHYIDKDFNAYMSTMGYEPLRNKIANKLKDKNEIDASSDNIIITSGVSGAIFLLFSSIINKGDEVILPDPYFVLYEQVLKYLGAKIVYLDTYHDFRLHPERLEKLINKKTKCIIINSPNNPTGMVYDKSELKKVAELASKFNTLIVSDEIYEDYDFEKKFFSIGSIYQNTVTMNGFSKNLSITGWRVGYAHGPSKIINAMNKLQMYSYVCVPGFAQAAICDLQNYSVYNYGKNRNLVYESLSEKYQISKPEGAFYAFFKEPGDKKDFFQKIIDNKLLLVPGSVFSQKSGYLRLSFAVKKEKLLKGIEILNKVI